MQYDAGDFALRDSTETLANRMAEQCQKIEQPNEFHNKKQPNIISQYEATSNKNYPIIIRHKKIPSQLCEGILFKLLHLIYLTLSCLTLLSLMPYFLITAL